MGQKNVLGQLLADGAAALHNTPGKQVGQHGPAEANGIDAEMTVKAPIFGGDNRMRQMLRKAVDLYRLAIDVAKAGDFSALIVQQCQGWFALDRG